jgi:hypothetical protein
MEYAIQLGGREELYVLELADGYDFFPDAWI